MEVKDILSHNYEKRCHNNKIRIPRWFNNSLQEESDIQDIQKILMS